MIWAWKWIPTSQSYVGHLMPKSKKLCGLSGIQTWELGYRVPTNAEGNTWIAYRGE
ncbi:hypothetical protein DPMN_061864, partial [Dreissena polymorpha]